MLKECTVVLNNDAVTVIKDGNELIQIPSIHRKADKVKVLIEGHKYTVVDDNYEIKAIIPEKTAETNVSKNIPKSNRKSKKTTSDETDSDGSID